MFVFVQRIACFFQTGVSFRHGLILSAVRFAVETQKIVKSQCFLLQQKIYNFKNVKNKHFYYMPVYA